MSAYEADFHDWALAQADAIRRRSANEIDWENVAEELESLGRSARQRLVSHLTVLLAHLLKWQFQPDRESRSWRASITEQRRQVAKTLAASPSLRPLLQDAFEDAYPGAVVWAVLETQDRVETDFPDLPPFTAAEALDPAWPEDLAAWTPEPR